MLMRAGIGTRVISKPVLLTREVTGEEPWTQQHITAWKEGVQDVTTNWYHPCPWECFGSCRGWCKTLATFAHVSSRSRLLFCSELQLGVYISDSPGELQTPWGWELSLLVSVSPSAPVPSTWLLINKHFLNASVDVRVDSERKKGKGEPWWCLSKCVTAKHLTRGLTERIGKKERDSGAL